MKKLFSILFVLITAVSASVSAQVADYRLNVQNFCELTVVDGIAVDCYCRPDSAGWAVFSCCPETASRIMFSNNAEVLTIQTDAEDAPVRNLPRIKVYTASLRKVENSGDSLVRVYPDVAVDNFKARLIGNGALEILNLDAGNVDASVTAGKGSLNISGKSHKVTLKNVGTGPMDASHLDAAEVKCFILGTGDIQCNPADKLRVFGAGTGKVVYHSHPGKISNRGIGVKALSSDAVTAAKLLSQL